MYSLYSCIQMYMYVSLRCVLCNLDTKFAHCTTPLPIATFTIDPINKERAEFSTTPRTSEWYSCEWVCKKSIRSNRERRIRCCKYGIELTRASVTLSGVHAKNAPRSHTKVHVYPPKTWKFNQTGIPLRCLVVAGKTLLIWRLKPEICASPLVAVGIKKIFY